MKYALIKRTVLSAALLGAGLAALADEQENEVQTLVKIDDFAVTNLHFALFASQTGRNPTEQEEQLSLLNEMINNFMVALSPQGRELAQDPEVAAALEVARARLIAQTFVRTELAKSPVSDEELRTLYTERYADVEGTEYKARHILLEKEQEAKDVIADLDGGAEFAALASERSVGPSKAVGGDLGWFDGDQMVAEFSAATAALEDGSYSKQPVKTQFGWHVILREESRATPPPSYDSVKNDLQVELQQRKVAAALNQIREASKIEVQ